MPSKDKGESRKDKKMTIEKIKKHVAEFGGMTLRPDGEEADLKAGYMVSLERFGSTVSFEGLDVEKVARYLTIAGKVGAYFGIYRNERKGADAYDLDISVNIRSRERAIAKGLAEHQDAIWDCAKGCEISFR